MATSHRVQAYLEKHKIGILFEELMGKVIADQPDEPVVYLIKTLERKAGRQSHSLRRSVDTGDSMSVPKERTYEKPWQTQSKKTRPSSVERGKKAAGPKPGWDHRTNTAGTFDELWDSKDERKWQGERSRSPSRKVGSVNWQESTEEDEVFTSHGYSGPRRQTNQNDTLAGEFEISKATSQTEAVQAKLSVPKHQSQQQNSMKHKQQLEKLVLSKKTAEDSGIEDDRDLEQQDVAVELMENLDDLKAEGVKEVKGRTGVAVRQSEREAMTMESAVRVSICARCAKVMGGEASESAPGVGHYGQLDQYDYEVGSRPQSAVRFSPESDEEFESVSQVTGPRRPVWQDDSDDESVTPRKGKHMFSSSAVPSKGRPMYSPEQNSAAIKPSNLKQTTAVQLARSADFQTAAVIARQQPAVNQTWSPQLDSSDEDLDLPQSGSTVASGRGAGWNVHNYDTDDAATSFYGSAGVKGRKDMTRPY